VARGGARDGLRVYTQGAEVAGSRSPAARLGQRQGRAELGVIGGRDLASMIGGCGSERTGRRSHAAHGEDVAASAGMRAGSHEAGKTDEPKFIAPKLCPLFSLFSCGRYTQSFGMLFF
jgi:hypothetical protein